MKRIFSRFLAIQAGVLLGAIAAGNAVAAESSAQVVTQPHLEVRNKLESDLVGGINTSSTNILNDVSNTIACAQQTKLYNKTNGTCVNIESTDVAPAEETGPFTKTWSTPGTYTFNVPDYTTIVMYAWGAGGGGSAGSYVCPPNANPYWYNYCIMYTVTYPQYLSTAIAYYGAYLAVTPASNGGDSGVMAPVPATAGGGKGGGVSGSPVSSGADETKTSGGSAGGAAGTYGVVGGAGGYAYKAFKNGAAGAPVKNTALTIQVGVGGAPSGNGGAGKPGKVSIYWMQRQ
ncbi:MAG TPA: hypothetical protein VHP58_01010 [Alphaproteobacteria bacterium]|nr:hypothetical protein [Alphaproteobacteria bacterium]